MSVSVKPFVAVVSGAPGSGKVEAARDVPLVDERIIWTLTDGTTRSQRADLLDETTPAETCAATPACVESRLIELRDTATGIDAQVLADLIVTDAEYADALVRTAECANDAGADVAVNDLTLESDTTSGAAIASCINTHLDRLGEARELTSARDRISRSEP